MRQIDQLSAWAAERGVTLEAFLDAVLTAKETIDPFVVVAETFQFFDQSAEATPTSAQVATCNLILEKAGFVCLDSVELLENAGFSLTPAEAKSVIDDTLALTWDTFADRYQDLAEQEYPDRLVGQ